MSLSDPFRSRSSRLLPAGAALCALLALAGCKVEPLYGTSARMETGAVDPAGARVASLEFAPLKENTRVGQEVRNHLIFLVNGGEGQPAKAAYKVDLSVVSRTTKVAVIQTTTNDQEPTAGTVQLTGSYSISKTDDGKLVARGSRVVSADFDHPIQPYADYRAELDAQDRAARELAEILRLAIILEIRKGSGAGS